MYFIYKYLPRRSFQYLLQSSKCFSWSNYDSCTYRHNTPNLRVSHPRVPQTPTHMVRESMLYMYLSLAFSSLFYSGVFPGSTCPLPFTTQMKFLNKEDFEPFSVFRSKYTTEPSTCTLYLDKVLLRIFLLF